MYTPAQGCGWLGGLVSQLGSCKALDHTACVANNGCEWEHGSEAEPNGNACVMTQKSHCTSNWTAFHMSLCGADFSSESAPTGWHKRCGWGDHSMQLRCAKTHYTGECLNWLIGDWLLDDPCRYGTVDNCSSTSGATCLWDYGDGKCATPLYTHFPTACASYRNAWKLGDTCEQFGTESACTALSHCEWDVEMKCDNSTGSKPYPKSQCHVKTGNFFLALTPIRSDSDWMTFIEAFLASKACASATSEPACAAVTPQQATTPTAIDQFPAARVSNKTAQSIANIVSSAEREHAGWLLVALLSLYLIYG